MTGFSRNVTIQIDAEYFDYQNILKKGIDRMIDRSYIADKYFDSQNI